MFWKIVCADGENRRNTCYSDEATAQADLPLYDQDCDAARVLGSSPCGGEPHRVEEEQG
jgi:hypothetical protein